MDKRFELSLSDFASALSRLREAVDMDETAIVRDAIIKRFEFTFETAWKAMHRWLSVRGVSLDAEAFVVLKRAFANSLIVDEGTWHDIRKNRNLTSHTYKEKLAIEVAAFVRAVAVDRFEELLATLRARAEE